MGIFDWLKRKNTKRQLRHNNDVKFYNDQDDSYVTINNGVTTYHRKKK